MPSRRHLGRDSRSAGAHPAQSFPCFRAARTSQLRGGCEGTHCLGKGAGNTQVWWEGGLGSPQGNHAPLLRTSLGTSLSSGPDWFSGPFCLWLQSSLRAINTQLHPLGLFGTRRVAPQVPSASGWGAHLLSLRRVRDPHFHTRAGGTPHPGHARRAHGPHLFTCTSHAAAPFHTRAGPHTRARAHKGRDFRAELACGSRPVLHRLSPSRPPPPPPGAPLAAEIEGGGPRGAQSRRAAPRSRSAVARGTAGARGPGPERGPQPWCERLCPEP